MRHRDAVFAAGAVGLLLFAGACSGSTPAAPSSPIPSTTPAPAPTPSQSASGCSLGKGEPQASCAARSPQLLSQVEAAIDKAVRDHPSYFDTSDQPVAGSYRVLDNDGYVNAVASNLESAGFCVNRKDDVLQLKNTNDFSEDYDILTARGYIFRGTRSYQATCTPANFPIEGSDAIKFIFVGYFGIACRDGVPAPGWSDGILPLKCTGAITATPKDWDGKDVPLEVHGPDIDWWISEGDGVVELGVQSANEPFNRILFPVSVGFFKVCATVLDKTGCMRGQVVP